MTAGTSDDGRGQELAVDESKASLMGFLLTSRLSSSSSSSPTGERRGGGGPTTTTVVVDVLKEMQNMERTIMKLETKLYQPKYKNQIDEATRRARRDVEDKCCYSSVWTWVPPNYYDTSLEQRRTTLGAQSVHQLCKSMLMENKSWDSTLVVTKKKKGGGKKEETSDRTYAKFYLVVVQYTAAIDSKKLELAIRLLRPMNGGRLDPKKFSFQVAKVEDNARLTGYETGSVTPFGLLDPNVPIVLSSAIGEGLKKTKPSPCNPFIYMGGGHVHLKLGLAIDEFVKATDAIVADVTESR